MSVWRLLLRRHEMRELLALALPVVVVQVGLMAMGVVDIIIVGHYATLHLAAVALGNTMFFTVAMFGLGVLLALDPVIAQAVGAGDTPAVARGVQRGVVLAAAVTVLLSIALLPIRPLLTLLRQPPEIVPLATDYVLVSIPGFLPFFFFVVMRQSLQAMKRMTPIVLTTVAANVVNAALNWVFVFGNLGSPEMGGFGSGLASTFARWFMALLLPALAWRELRPLLLPVRRDTFDRGAIARMFLLGLPIGTQFLLEGGVFSVVGLLMAGFGAVAIAGHQVAINLASFTFMVPLGISAASAVLVGHAIGRRDPSAARRAAFTSLLLGAGFMGLSALTLSLFPDVLAHVYTSEAPVIAIASSLIPIAGVFQIFDGIQVVATGVLRGAGDTRTPMIVNLAGFWAIGLPISLVLGFRLGGGPTGLWWGLVAGLAAVAIFLVIRVRVRFSRSLERVRIDAPLPLEAGPGIE